MPLRVPLCLGDACWFVPVCIFVQVHVSFGLFLWGWSSRPFVILIRSERERNSDFPVFVVMSSCAKNRGKGVRSTFIFVVATVSSKQANSVSPTTYATMEK